MPVKLRRIGLGVIVGGLAVLAAIAMVRRPGLVAYQPSTTAPPIRHQFRTSSGLPMASIFEGVTGSKLDVAIVNALVAEAKAPPRDPCHKKTKNSSSRFLDAFAPPSVFADAGDCSSDCTSHYNKNWFPPSDCWNLELCEYGPVYGNGCMGALYDCGTGAYACGQTTCPNP